MQFFNFGNDATYLFFEWIRRGAPSRDGSIDLQKLIQNAFDRVESNKFFGADVSLVARDELAEALILLAVQRFGLSDDEPHADDIVGQFVHSAVSSIDMQTVAEALLIDAGKWSPDLELPEIQ